MTIRDLTGAPGYIHKVDKTKYLAEKLIDWDRKNYVITCGLDSSKDSSEHLKELGLITEHAYGIIQVKRL